MKSNYYCCTESQYQNRRQQEADQSADIETTNTQKQTQKLYIKKSHNVTINQVQAQALIALAVSLQAAIEAAITVLDAQDDVDTTDLQQLDQQLKVLQLQKEIIAIECCDDISITQTQLQIEAVVQAVIQLLARITAKLVEA